MNVRLLAKLLGILSLLIGFFMLLSLPWALPNVGIHTDSSIQSRRFETDGFRGLVYSAVISWAVGGLLLYFGRDSEKKLYRKEAMAVVGLSWILATILGSLPFIFSGTCRGPSVRVIEQANEAPLVLVATSRYKFWKAWDHIEDIDSEQAEVLKIVAESGTRGLTGAQIVSRTGLSNAADLFESLHESEPFSRWLYMPGQIQDAPADRASRYRLKWVRMGIVDSMFEAQSGFSTTGATVLSDLEDPHTVPHCILFWRSSTHFLGGLGIIVLFVVILGQGSAGKALMRAEMPGPTHDNSSARTQDTAWLFAGIYVALNVLLALILMFLGMSLFDAVCHAFATMATGGFSTYNASLGHFNQNLPELNGKAIEYVTILFMIMAGTNFTLLFLLMIGKAKQVWRDSEFRAYLGLIAVVSLAIMVFGLFSGDRDFANIESAFRNGLFQVVSIVTTTGYGTADYDQWNHFGRAALLALMFVGGCAGSTGGGMKVIRHVLFFKILGLETEHSFRPKVVRMIRLGGEPVEDQTLRHSILVYFGLIGILFVAGWLLIMMIEPSLTWGANADNKLIDSASAVASTLNNIGPGLGLVGPTQNYANFSFTSKSIFIWLMMMGRLEIFPILVLFSPAFWRDQ